jgi:hypothetical protein
VDKLTGGAGRWTTKTLEILERRVKCRLNRMLPDVLAAEILAINWKRTLR